MNIETPYTETKKQQVPELRFKEFDEEITETEFGKHYSFHITNSLSRDKLNYESGMVRNIHYGDIHKKFESHFYLVNENVPFINEDIDLSKIKEDSYCKVGDIVIADASEDYADIGKSIELMDINNEKLLAGLHTFLARPISDITAVGFIIYLLKSWKLRKQIMTIAQGTKVLSLSTGRVSKLKINIPTLPEQKKIASFLASVDEKIQQLTKKKDLLEHYKKGVMQQLFSGELRFKDENGNAYPDWEEVVMEDIFKRVTKKNKENNLNVLTISAQMGLVNQRNYFNRSVSAKDVTGYYLIENGDFAYNKSYSKGYPMGAIKRLNFYNKGVVSTLYICFRIRENDDSTFYKEFLDHGGINRELHKIAQEGARNHGLLNMSVIEFFRDIKIPHPSIEEQKVIGKFLEDLSSKIEIVNEELIQTQTFKKGLLQQLFV